MKPKILFMTDDFQDEFLEDIKEQNHMYEITFIKRIINMYDYPFSNYDAVVMDYGLMGEDTYLFQKIYQSGVKMAWCGALSGRYNGDARRMFPKLRFLHHLLSADIDEIPWLFDTLFEDTDPNKQNGSKAILIKNKKENKE